MIIASQLRPGAVLKLGEDLLKVIESTYHLGQGKMPGSVHAKLRNIRKGTFKELRWRSGGALGRCPARKEGHGVSLQ